MSVNTILLDFSVDPISIKSETQLSDISSNIEKILRDYLPNFRLGTHLNVDGGLLRIYTSDFEGTTQLRIYGNGLVTINIDYLKGEKQEPFLSYEKCKEIVQAIREQVVEIKWSTTLMPVKRGTMRFYPTSDDRLLEYDIDDMLFEETTPFQKVQIVHSLSMGNMLVLDGLQNISEADLVYTETLMARGKEDYRDKEIVILGGGDGALLYELLKEKPKEVIMLEIDDVVMKACAKHMRSICGDVLDNMSGPNYKIIVGDCMLALEQYIAEGRKFDYIFGDLTDVPISESLSGELWTFINKILKMSFKMLKPDGKFMTHIIGTSSPNSIVTYESQLRKLQPPVKYTKSKAFIPSFMEEWVFCQVSFDHDNKQL